LPLLKFQPSYLLGSNAMCFSRAVPTAAFLKLMLSRNLLPRCNFQMETSGSSEIFIPFNQSTGCHIMEDCRKNVIYYVLFISGIFQCVGVTDFGKI